MTPHDEHFPPRVLADLLDQGKREALSWSAVDLRQILSHTLDAPPTFEVEPGEADIHIAARPMRQMLIDDPAPADALAAAKDYFKAVRNTPEHPLPPEIAAALYYSCICAALIAHDAWITTTEARSFQTNLGWLIDQAWIETPLHDLFRTARDRLNRT